MVGHGMHQKFVITQVYLLYFEYEASYGPTFATSGQLEAVEVTSTV